MIFNINSTRGHTGSLLVLYIAVFQVLGLRRSVVHVVCNLASPFEMVSSVNGR